MPRLIINGDDFGLSADNNAGIIAAHRAGVLTSTSLMVGGDAAAEAIELARQYPTLAIGLHANFSDTKPILRPEQIPLLVQPNGYFPSDDTHRKALWSREGRRQLRAEIAAQFRAFAATGLAWDHVNSHRNFHSYPPLAWMLFREAAKWPVKVTRVFTYDLATDPVRYLRAIVLRRLARIHGLTVPDRSIGREWSIQVLLELLRTLPDGAVDLNFHPGHQMFPHDLPILLAESVQGALAGVSLGSMGELAVREVRRNHRLTSRNRA